MKSAVAGKLAATLCLAVIGVLVPVLEMNSTHLFNPAWPAHSRLHEAWQLATNTGLSAWAIHLAWRHRMRVACIIGQFLSGGFLLAWATRSAYGGSMAGTTSAATAIVGIDAAVLVMALAFVVFTVVGINSSGARARSCARH